MISKEIKKLIPILGKENTKRLTMAYLMGDEKTRERIFELVDTVKASTFAHEGADDSVLMEAPPQHLVNKGNINIGNILYGNLPLHPFLVL